MTGGSVGLAGILQFTAVQFGLWAAMGRPEGSEARLFALAAPLLERRYRKHGGVA